MHRKQILTIIILQIASLLNVCAQEALCSWLSPPTVEVGRQYLFRRDFLPSSDVGEANVSISSNGPFRLFVNGRVVCSVYDADNNKTYNVDVSDYMCNDSNTVAVWCAPDVNLLPDDSSKQMLALCFYGKYADGKPFSCATDSSWLCAPSPALSSADGELVDARETIDDWNMRTLPLQMKWTNVKQTGILWTDVWSLYNARKISDYNIKVIKPTSFDVDDDGTTVTYNFGKPFWGTYRITVRDAKRGERIFVDGSEYVCRGVLDEQFVGRLVHKGIRKVVITGDNKFRKSHVVKVEGIAVSPFI